MPPEQWSKVISSAVVPVVIISACGLLCLTFYNRLASMVSRLRGFHRERLEEQQEYARQLFAGTLDRFTMVRHHRILDMLDIQTSRVTRRARLVRRTLLALLATVCCLTLCSLATGLSMVWPPAMYTAAGLFLLGSLLFLVAILLALMEMLGALEPVELEREFVSRLSKELDEMARGYNGTIP